MKRLIRIAIRADGSRDTGMGHLYRGLAIAEMLSEEFDISFITCTPNSIIHNEIARFGGKVIEITDVTDKESDVNAVLGYSKDFDCIILDGYHFTEIYQKILKASGLKVVSVDDQQEGRFVSDVLVNHIIGTKREMYDLDPHTKTCFGTDYAILRKPFLDEAKRGRIIDKVKSVFINMGGVDKTNATLTVLRKIADCQKFENVYVVVGASYAYYDELYEFTIKNRSSRIVIFKNLNSLEMISVMQKCEIAICPSSTVAYEACCVGMYLIVGYLNDSQVEAAKKISEYGLGSLYGSYNNIDANDLLEVINLTISQKSMIEVQKKAFNRLQIENFKRIFLNLLANEM